MVRPPNKSRRRLVGGVNAVVIGVAVIVTAILINAVFSQVFWRYDMTDNQIFTLSEVSEDSVANLEEPVKVRAFISQNMPAPYHHLSRQVEELLMEYEAASNGMLTFEIISPDDDAEIEELASGYGIEQVTIGQETDRERSYRAVYKGIAFVQADRVEVVPELRASGVPEVDNFEYEFTRSILNIKQSEPQKVAVLSSAGGPAGNSQFVELMQMFFDEMYGDLLKIEPLDLTELKDVPDDYSALIILNIDRDLGEQSLLAIDRFIRRGGNIGWFQSGGVVDERAYMERAQQMQAAGHQQMPAPVRSPLKSDLTGYFQNMGIHFGGDAVIDRERALAYGSVQTEQGQVPVSHPAIFPITDMAHELPFMRYFSALVFPLPSTWIIDEAALPQGVEVYEVLRTDPTSVRLSSPPGIPIYEELLHPMTGEEQGSFLVAAALEAEFPGYLDDDHLPDDKGQEARILVVGSGDLLSGYPEVGYHGELAGLGIQFFLSSVEWLAQEHELAAIRGKQMPALIAEIPTEAKQSIQIINIAVVPGFFASIGLLMLVRRRRRKSDFAEMAMEGETIEKEELRLEDK